MALLNEILSQTRRLGGAGQERPFEVLSQALV